MRLVLGIPSLDEADTIEAAARGCAAAVGEMPPEDRFFLLHCDSGSTDGTVELFESLDLGVESASIDSGGIGKGRNVAAMARFVVDGGYDGLIICDADVAPVRPEWIAAMRDALAKGHDAVFCRRPPLWNRGDLTYHLCSPALAAIRSMRVHEPIAPTQAYRRSLLAEALTRDWDSDLYEYGIDIWLAALAAPLNWVEIVMREPLTHKLRSFAAGPGQLSRGDKFPQVLRTVRRLAASERGRDAPPLAVRVSGDPSLLAFGRAGRDPDYDRLTARCESAVVEVLGSGRCGPALAGALAASLAANPWRGLGWPAWRDALVDWLGGCSDALTPADMEILLLARCAGFYHEALGRADWYGIVEEQAADFVRHWQARGRVT